MPAVPITEKDDWIRVGYELLDQRGLTGVSIERIATELGSSRSGFYHRFANRQELLDAIVERWMADGYALIDEYDHVDDPIARYRSIVSGLLKSPRLRIADTALLVLGAGESGFSDRRERVRNDFILLGGELLRQAGIDGHSCEQRAMFVWIGYLGLLSEIDSRPAVPSDAEMDTLVELLIARAVA